MLWRIVSCACQVNAAGCARSCSSELIVRRLFDGVFREFAPLMCFGIAVRCVYILYRARVNI